MPFIESYLQSPKIIGQHDLLNVPYETGLLLEASRSLNITKLSVDYSIAFQPIVNIFDKSVFGYEALIRGVNNEGAEFVLSQLNETNRYQFDQATKVKAINLAKKLNLQGMLSINISPSSVYKPEVCIPKILETAWKMDFPTNRLMFEVSEKEEITDHAFLREIFTECKKHSITTAIDNFGAGYAGLNLLADWQPDIVKLDMSLTRNINSDKVRRTLVNGTVLICKEIGIKLIAEGIETKEECLTLAEMGINLFQGYLFAKPSFESLPVLSDEV